jgi:glycerol uptake facilitator-like aquaporin
MKFDLTRRLVAEALGTFFLVMAVVGSGIMAAKLAGGNEAIALLCNTLPTGAVLFVIITIFISVSGAHFNPAVSLGTARTGFGQWLGEFIATFGLIGTILGCVRFKPDALITSAYWFTSSTSFANRAACQIA